MSIPLTERLTIAEQVSRSTERLQETEGLVRRTRVMRVAVLRHGETIESGLVNPDTLLSEKGICTIRESARDFFEYLVKNKVTSAAIKPFCSSLPRCQQSLNVFLHELGLSVVEYNNIHSNIPVKIELLDMENCSPLTAKGNTLKPWATEGITQAEAMEKWFGASEEEHKVHGSVRPEQIAYPILGLIGNLYKDLDTNPLSPGPDFIPLFVTSDTTHVSLLKALNPDIQAVPKISNGQTMFIEVGNTAEGIDYLFDRHRYHLDVEGRVWLADTSGEIQN